MFELRVTIRQKKRSGDKTALGLSPIVPIPHSDPPCTISHFSPVVICTGSLSPIVLLLIPQAGIRS